MKANRTKSLVVGIGAVCVVMCPARLHAGPMLLATAEVTAGWGTNEPVGPLWPIVFYTYTDYPSPEVILFEDFDLPDDFPLYLRETVDATNDLDFELFAALASDGVSENQDVNLGLWDGTGRAPPGWAAPEEVFFSLLTNWNVPRLGPDFVEYEITHITRDMFVSVEEDWVGPNGHTYATFWNSYGTYEFYGTPIPEPSTLVLMALGLLAVSRRRRR